MNFEDKCECGMNIPRGYGYYNYGQKIKCFGCGRLNRKDVRLEKPVKALRN